MAMMSVPGQSKSGYTYTTTTVLRCTLCGMEFLESQRKEAENHTLYAHPEAVLIKCKLCGATLKNDSETEVIAHIILNHQGEFEKILNLSPRVFPESQDLKNAPSSKSHFLSMAWVALGGSHRSRFIIFTRKIVVLGLFLGAITFISYIGILHWLPKHLWP